MNCGGGFSGSYLGLLLEHCLKICLKNLRCENYCLQDVQFCTLYQVTRCRFPVYSRHRDNPNFHELREVAKILSL